jgi:hypothetical protein
MEENYSTELLISKNDYIGRLINILTPQIIVGVKSILKSAIELCNNNSEDEKYLMTFQNFLAQIPSWNQTTIDKEKNRIIEESSCDYLEDLVTCIHLIHFKISTSVNVGNKNIKKIDINIPKFDVFIHQAYCEVARNVWSNIFLFHVDVEPLEYQKNMREVEMIIRESLINTVRNNIPIKDVINTYLEESEEYLENYVSKKEESQPQIKTEELPQIKTEELPQIKTEELPQIKTEELPQIQVEAPPQIQVEAPPQIQVEAPPQIQVEAPPQIKTEEPPQIQVEELDEVKQTISFNNKDEVMDLGTNKIEILDAPKDVATLEKKSEERSLAELEDDDENLKIGADINISLTNDIVEL